MRAQESESHGHGNICGLRWLWEIECQLRFGSAVLHAALNLWRRTRNALLPRVASRVRLVACLMLADKFLNDDHVTLDELQSHIPGGAPADALKLAEAVTFASIRHCVDFRRATFSLAFQWHEADPQRDARPPAYWYYLDVALTLHSAARPEVLLLAACMLSRRRAPQPVSPALRAMCAAHLDRQPAPAESER